MTKKILIFGNGLGRAIDNDFFSLDRALQVAWDDELVLDEGQKALIYRCLPDDLVEDESTLAPRSEDELDKLQQIVAACDLVNELETETAEGWLSEQGKAFPAAIRSYLHRAACEFHFGNHVLPEEFAKPLRNHIIENKSHVATLNYDKLLYENFIGTDVFNGFSCLIDGFSGGTFSRDNLARHNKRRTSYYLHLHGSPLFHDDSQNTCHKAHIAEAGLIAGDASGHIVLTNVKHKRSVISASPVLRDYWRILEKRALPEATEIIIVGYSGTDTHLNHLVQKKQKLSPNCAIRVIEREGEGDRVTREDFWTSVFGEIELIRMESILDFVDW